MSSWFSFFAESPPETNQLRSFWLQCQHSGCENFPTCHPRALTCCWHTWQASAPILHVSRSRARAYALQTRSLYVASHTALQMHCRVVFVHLGCARVWDRTNSCRREVQLCVGLQLVPLPPRLDLLAHVTPVGRVSSQRVHAYTRSTLCPRNAFAATAARCARHIAMPQMVSQ